MWFGPRPIMTREPPQTEEIEARLGVDVDTLSPVGKLWLQSWDLSDSLARSQMGSSLPYDRSFNWRNIRSGLQLVGLLWRNLFNIVVEAGRKEAVFSLGTRVLRGCFPAVRLWARKEMLDMVQKSFESPLPRSLVLKTAVQAIALAASEDVFHILATESDMDFKQRINIRLKRAYLAAKMSLSIPSQESLYASALLADAGLFCNRDGEMSDAYRVQDCISSLFSTFSRAVEVWSQLFLLFGTISSGYDQSHFSTTNIALILLSLVPSLLRVVSSRYYFRRSFEDRTASMTWYERRRKIERLEKVAQESEYKQEVMMFQFRDWLLEKWTKKHAKASRMTSRHEGLVDQFVRTALQVGQNSVDTIFYAILAARLLPTSLSLGSIEMYQSSANSLLSSVRMLMATLNLSFQSIFRFAAFVEATSDPEAIENAVRLHRNRSIPLLDYETIRHSRGMKIEARDLSFTYPGGKAPTLHNINFTIQPGETLAVVGVNGGGKTTLIKILLGIHRHDGDLYINDRPMESLDPRSLYARTSCLFQDFARYPFTISQNVVVGDTTRADKTEDIVEAMRRGGAEEIATSFGMRRRLTGKATIDPARLHRMQSKAAEDVTKTEDAAGEDDKTDKPDSAVNEKREKYTKSVRTPRVALSGGQWQRVALSRAFLRADRADLIVFDEPSSALDPKAEAELFQRIHDLSSREDGLKPTTVYVSHRFSTVKRADRILVMEGGSIVEIGSHAELMALEGKYAEMFNLQAHAFA